MAMSSPNAPMIRARSLTKRFGERVAVSGIDFDVNPGEFFGFLGPNGGGDLRVDAGQHGHGRLLEAKKGKIAPGRGGTGRWERHPAGSEREALLPRQSTSARKPVSIDPVVRANTVD